MIKTFCLFVFPISGLIVFLFVHILYHIWLEARAYGIMLKRVVFNITTPFHSNIIVKQFFIIFKTFLFLFCIFFFKILKLHDCDFKVFYFNNLIFTELFIYTIFFIFFIILLLYNNLFIKKYTLDLGIFLLNIYLFTIILLCSNNILVIFLILEIINLLIIYSFLINLQLHSFSPVNLVNNYLCLVNTCIYQFILNFFSSIVFFFAFNLLVSYTYSTNFLFLSNFNLNFFNLNIYLNLLYISIFIKLGIGPWIFFKLEIYQNFNFLLLILYTLIYFLTIITFFFNLFIIYCLPINYLSLLLILILSIITIWYFSFYIFNYFNIFIFFSFSSLLNLGFFLIQLSLILITWYF